MSWIPTLHDEKLYPQETPSIVVDITVDIPDIRKGPQNRSVVYKANRTVLGK